MRYTSILALAALTLSAAPALAQDNERVLTIFGKDRCPANTICVTAPEAERFRIPRQLRGPSEIAPENQSWAQRSAVGLAAGASGPGSCSASGPNGWTGCWAAQMRAARAERKATATARPVIDGK